MYTMIAHGRFYVKKDGSDGHTERYKYDVANAKLQVQVQDMVIDAPGSEGVNVVIIIVAAAVLFFATLAFAVNMRTMKNKVEFLKDEVKKRQWTPEEMMLIKQVMENRNKETDKELQSVLLNSNEIVLKEKIGRGAFGEVHKGTHRGTEVAIKTLLEVDSTSVERFRAEILLMKDLKHPCVVLLIGAAWSSDLIGMVMELMQRGAMTGVLQDQVNNPLTWKQHKLPWAEQIISGIKYLHESRFYDESKKAMQECIIHRDLKPDNILINNSMQAKLSDFGESRAVMNEAQQTMTAVGTTFYVAPEIMLGEKYGAPADIFSYAITLCAMTHIKSKNDKLLGIFTSAWEKSDLAVNGAFPTQHAVTDAVISKELRPELSDDIPQSLRDLIKRCWSRNQNSRPSVNEILEKIQGQIKSDVESSNI